jgi:biopolymer transport protein ExbD
MVFLEMVEVNNPELRISRQVKEKDFVTITITKDGKLFLNKDPVSSDKELSRRLVEKKTSGNDVTVIINGDTDAPLGDALHILQAVREADLPKVFFKTESSGNG